MSIQGAVYALLAVGLASALVGGVFQAFSDFVMKGLVMADPPGGMASMQHINRTVFRSVFLATFLALVPITSGLAVYASLRLGGGVRNLIIAGAVVYVLTVFVVTMLGNVPMNEKLDKMELSLEASQAYWVTYGRVWTRWNHIRTLGSVVTAALFLVAAVSLAGRSTGPDERAGVPARSGPSLGVCSRLAEPSSLASSPDFSSAQPRRLVPVRSRPPRADL